MKIKIVAILSAVLVCTFAPLSIFASADEPQILHYSNFVIDKWTDENGVDYITLDLPLDYIKHRIYTVQDGVQSETYWEYFGNEYALYSKGVPFLFKDEIYILGDNYLDADIFPDDTIISYSYSIFTDAESIQVPDNVYMCTSKAYAIARDKNYDALAWNVGTPWSVIKPNDEHTVKCTFGKPLGTKYIDPMISIYDFQYDADRDVLEQYHINIKINYVRLEFSVDSAIRQEEETGRRNELLEYIISGSTGQKEEADKLNSDVDSLISDADNVKEELNDMFKPDASIIADSIDTFDVVTEANIDEYTNIFEALLEAEIVRNMLLVCVSLSMISLVLFGKKG